MFRISSFFSVFAFSRRKSHLEFNVRDELRCPLEQVPPCLHTALTVENTNGKEITRKLFRCKAPLHSEWTHLKEFWRIRQEVKVKSKINSKPAIEERYFITSIDSKKLSDVSEDKALKIVAINKKIYLI